MKYSIVNEDKKEKKQDDSQFLAVEPKWNLDDIILSSSIKTSLKEVIAFCKKKEIILEKYNVKKFVKSDNLTIAINFFGVSGTGKSITAEAIAKELSSKIIHVDYSQIEGMFHGETQKNLTKLFDKAEKEGFILFFDEADAVLGKRVANVTQATDHSINQAKSHLLNLLDRKNVVVIFATNFFENYDQAFFRRILFHIGFELPNRDSRVQIWEYHLDKSIPKSTTYDWIAEISEGLSGGDIKNIAFKLIIKLAVESIKELTNEVVQQEIENYQLAKKMSLPTKQTIVFNDK
ncbi:MAG: ATP-binding protein [Cytophagales bacterium]|nr:MAG: ATP-binding protein [Cytophagales bacterium]